MVDKILEQIRAMVKVLDLPLEVLDGFEIQKLTTTSKNTLLETYEKVGAGETPHDCLVVVVAPLRFAGRIFPLVIRCYCDLKGRFQVIQAMLLDDILIYSKEVEHPHKDAKLSREMDFLLATTSGVLANLITQLLTHMFICTSGRFE